MRIKVQAKTDKRLSWMTGRNGTYSIDMVDIAGRSSVVSINARSANTGNLLNGGLVIESTTMDKLATGWLEKRKEQNG